jgi:hypothetical protein
MTRLREFSFRDAIISATFTRDLDGMGVCARRRVQVEFNWLPSHTIENGERRQFRRANLEKCLAPRRRQVMFRDMFQKYVQKHKTQATNA